MGFANASYILVIARYVQHGISLESTKLNPEANDSDWMAYLRMFSYVSLGEVSSTPDYSELMMVLHISFIILSTVLMLCHDECYL